MKKMTLSSLNSKNINENVCEIDKGLTNLGTWIIKHDPFQMGGVAGNAWTKLFYISFILGVLSVILGLTLTIIPGTSREDLIKQELLFINNQWFYHQTPQVLSNSEIQVSFFQEKHASKNEEQQSNNQQKASESMQLIDQMINMREKGINTTYLSGLNKMTPFSLISTHFEQVFSLKEQQENHQNIQENVEYCVIMKVRNAESKQDDFFTLQTQTKCASKKNSISVKPFGEFIISFNQMIKMSLCSENESCEKMCLLNEGTAHPFLERDSKDVHSKLDKHLERQINSCKASFAAKELCFVVKMSNNSQTLKEIVRGCYENQFELYDFAQNVESLKIIVREESDPFLAALSFSKDYSPYQVTQTQKEKKALLLYLIGVMIFFILLAALVLVRIKQERQQNSLNKVSHQVQKPFYNDLSFV